MRVSGRGFEAVGDEPYDIVINATSASIDGAVPPVEPTVLGPQTLCYDMMYGSTLTPFGQWAVDHGCARVFDGLGMLVEQAAESFFLWRGVRPRTVPVLSILRGVGPR